MTENKGFDCQDEFITLNGGVFAIAKSKNDAELISKTLKQVYNENEQLKQTIRCICKDYEEFHGMDIRNADWFTAW